MRHSNICSEVIAPNTCNKCQHDIISKVALKKHMPKCQGKKQSEACKNGDSCRWFKANVCLSTQPRDIRQIQIKTNNQSQIGGSGQDISQTTIGRRSVQEKDILCGLVGFVKQTYLVGRLEETIFVKCTQISL